ncbi:hypothetical protein THOM_2338 [Trachipleistophora hominis]|uniref:Uncharacterized protein n=1 Tax=Trachipleistophora hominis TaxID=72359 RepID=L7JTV8_TRAHO|nr:hypothetical protein THOM_2338 [Trachipleistophora hominis]
MEFLSGSMRFLLIQEANTDWLKKLENGVQNYSILIHEIFERLYKAHCGDKECPFDDDAVNSLSLLSDQFATEFENEGAFWSKQRIKLKNYIYVYDECMLETWEKLYKKGITDRINIYINRKQVLKH